MAKDLKKSPNTNLEPNMAAFMACLFPPVTGVVFYIVEKDDEYVRFHSMQSIVFGAAVYLATFTANILKLLYVGYVLAQIVWVVAFAFWVVLLIKTYNHENYELPVLGDMAKGFMKKS